MRGQKKWVFPPPVDAGLQNQLMDALDVPPVIAKILLQRGWNTPEKAHQFLNPSLESLHDPFLMKDIAIAANRLAKALQNKERIMVYGDYDVDGITGTSLLLSVLRRLGGDVDFYIPDRMNEGYGLSIEGIRQALRDGISLIVTVDCGIRATDEAKFAEKVGIDMIVTDHHEPGENPVEALAVINPKQTDDTYPFTDLCGAGVAFKLLCAVTRVMNKPLQIVFDYLDIVALGTISDIVPLVDENRVIAHYGLRLINTSPRVGLKALIHVAGLKQRRIGSSEIVFNLAPRINAGGRIGDAKRGVELLMATTYSHALKIANGLDAENKRRQNIDETIYEDAKRMVEEMYDIEHTRGLVLASEEWHAGVIGIVASRLVEKYYRPTVLISIDPETGAGKGSSRSIPTFHLYEAMVQCSDLLDEFGGHQHAAGLTIRKERIHAFRERFNAVATNALTPEDLIPHLEVVGEVTLDDVINGKLYVYLKQFAPFGPQNMRPVLVTRRVDVVGTPRIVGRNHLKFTVGQGDVTLEIIGFGFGTIALVDELTYARPKLDIAYVVEENRWHGRITLQGRLKDLKFSE
ncbi:MAG: single-stranded-DNA-specific exonuclease RecJ [Gemmatimonadetes bacterium]|nr:MAG: single-stranded-DNA-specific exonuclease RecJ [Gemmatimonadota bacterium]